MNGATGGGHTEAAVLDGIYEAVESFDPDRIRRLLGADVFVLTPTADGVLTGQDQVIADLRRWSEAATSRGGVLRVHVVDRRVGTSPSGRGEWVFDAVEAEVEVGGGDDTVSVPIRVTALVAVDGDGDGGAQLAAAYWSVPFETQEAQDAVKAAGELLAGAVLDEQITNGAEPFVDSLRAALADPHQIPRLYSTGDDHVTLGSVTTEAFLGPSGHAAWDEFVQFVTAFEVRGPMRAGLVGDDVGWLAANIDIGQPPTPYRFFYVWVRDESGWRIVVSHDAVSRDPCAQRTS